MSISSHYVSYGGVMTDKSDWTAKVKFGDANNTASLLSSCPRCSFQNPTLQVFLDLLSSCENSIGMLHASCLCGTQGGPFEGTSLSVHDPSNRYKPACSFRCRFLPLLTWLFYRCVLVVRHFRFRSDVATIRSVASSHIPDRGDYDLKRPEIFKL